jgi:membrane protein implicated in regulation of membrane protease activity
MSLAVFLIPSIILNPITNPVLVAIVTISALIFLITGIGGIAFALIGISLLIIQKRSQRKEKKENKTFINEGSGV